MPDYIHGEKFWAPEVRGKQLYLRFGKVGMAGQTRLKDFATAAAAKAELARIVDDKLADGYTLRGANKSAAKKPKKAAVPPNQRAALLAIAQELGTAKTVREIAHAIDDPDGFAERFIETYETIEDADHAEMPWLALIESLESVKKLWEVDWKEYASEVLACLVSIGGAPAKKALRTALAVEEDDLDERYTHEALELFGSLLGAAKLALVQLDKSSDSYALAIVPAARVAPLQKLARTAKQSIEHISGKKLAEYERDRMKELAKSKTTNPWSRLVVDNAHQKTGTAVDSVLWNLNHDYKGDLLVAIRAAAPFAPAKDRPFVDLVLALHAAPGAPVELAKTSREPARVLEALRYMFVHDPVKRHQRLAAAAILADRLGVKPDCGKLHEDVAAACNVWNEKSTDKLLAKLDAKARDRLARLADGMLAKTKGEGGTRWATAFRFLGTCGDLASIPAIEAAGVRAYAARKANEYSLEGPFVWDETKKAILRRAKSRR